MDFIGKRNHHENYRLLGSLRYPAVFRRHLFSVCFAGHVYERVSSRLLRDDRLRFCIRRSQRHFFSLHLLTGTDWPGFPRRYKVLSVQKLSWLSLLSLASPFAPAIWSSTEYGILQTPEMSRCSRRRRAPLVDDSLGYFGIVFFRFLFETVLLCHVQSTHFKQDLKLFLL